MRHQKYENNNLTNQSASDLSKSDDNTLKINYQNDSKIFTNQRFQVLNYIEHLTIINNSYKNDLKLLKENGFKTIMKDIEITENHKEFEIKETIEKQINNICKRNLSIYNKADKKDKPVDFSSLVQLDDKNTNFPQFIIKEKCGWDGIQNKENYELINFLENSKKLFSDNLGLIKNKCGYFNIFNLEDLNKLMHRYLVLSCNENHMLNKNQFNFLIKINELVMAGKDCLLEYKKHSDTTFKEIASLLHN